MKYYTSTTEYNCGIDLHARQMYVCVMDRQGQKLVHTNVKNNDFEFFLKLVASYRHDLTVCCECMFGWYWLSDADSDEIGHRFRFYPDRIPADVGQRSGVCRTVARSEATLGFVHYSLQVRQSSTSTGTFRRRRYFKASCGP